MYYWQFPLAYSIKHSAEVTVSVGNIVSKAHLLILLEKILKGESVELLKFAFVEEARIGLACDILASTLPSLFIFDTDLDTRVELLPCFAIVEDGKFVQSFCFCFDFEIEPTGVTRGVDIVMQQQSVHIIHIRCQTEVSTFEPGVEL